MKRSHIFCFCIFIFLGVCKAQFSYGPRLGLSVPAMFADGADPFTNRPVVLSEYDYKYINQPFYVGVFGAYRIKGRSSLHVDLFYTNNGFGVQKRVTYQGLIENPTDITINMPELTTNVMYKHDFLNHRLNALGGVYLSKLFKNEMDTYTPLVFPEWEVNVVAHQKTQLRPYDFGFVIGGEYFLTKKLFIEARMNFGIADMVYRETILKITPTSLGEVKPAFYKALNDHVANSGNQQDVDKFSRVAQISDENGRFLTGVSIYRFFTQIGIGWRFTN